MNLIILDRDGVINRDSDDFIKSPEEWIPIPGSMEAIARLHHAGYRVVVFTNQSGLARGHFDLDALNRIHAKMHQHAQDAGGIIDAIFFCPDADEASPCRKPNTGMLEEISRRLRFNLTNVPIVGDALRDIQAAQAVGARPLLVRTGKGEQTLAAHKIPKQIKVFDNLVGVADFILLEPD